MQNILFPKDNLLLGKVKSYNLFIDNIFGFISKNIIMLESKILVRVWHEFYFGLRFSQFNK